LCALVNERERRAKVVTTLSLSPSLSILQR
jgi:hypothetical protein